MTRKWEKHDEARAVSLPLDNAQRLMQSSVLVVDGQPRELRLLERILKGTVGKVEAREHITDVPEDGAYDLIALAYDTLASDMRRTLLRSLANPG